jgi:hypothetical protein
MGPTQTAVPTQSAAPAASSSTPQSQGNFWTGTPQATPQQAQQWLASPQNQQLLNSATMMRLSGNTDMANQMLAGTPLQQNTGGALGSIARSITGETQDPIEGLTHLALASGLQLLRNQQAQNYMQGEPNQMQNLASQQLAAQRQNLVGY